MRRPSVLLTLCALCSCASVDQEQAVEDSLTEVPSTDLSGTVVFYNVENLFDTVDDPDTQDDDFTPDGALKWTADRYRTKLEHLAAAIGLSGSDLPLLIGLAEVENREVVEELATTGGLADGRYTTVHFDSPDERGIDVALLVREAQVLSSKALAVDLGTDRTRDILYAQLLLGGSTWHVYVNHWPSRREGEEKSAPKRMTAARTLREHLGSTLRTEPGNVLIMGDLNDAPLDASVQQGLGAGCDLRSQLVDLMCRDQPKGHGSHNYQGEWTYLDQFIVDRTLAERVTSAKAVWNQQLLFRHPRYGSSPDRTYSGRSYKGGYSDHLPIVLRFGNR